VFLLGYGGACPTKLGQWAATRADLFSEEICQALSQLHSSAPKHSYNQTKSNFCNLPPTLYPRKYWFFGFYLNLLAIIEEAFQKSVEELFIHLEKEPIASGAVAQVHRGTIMLEDFEYPVAVKIRHPGVCDNIRLDLSIIRLLASIVRISCDNF
jgi:aarF domain-containing kinase